MTGERPSDDEWPALLFWLGHEAGIGERVTLDPEESHHLLRVVRHRVGDRITLADGAGGWLGARVVELARRGVRVEIEDVRPSPAEPRRSIHLGFPPLRPGRTEILLEKCTELGVTCLTPLRTARARPGGPRPARWERIVRSAAMQSLRSRPPELTPVTDFEEWVCSSESEVEAWVGRPGGASPDAVAGTGPVRALVGPEGDLTTAEWDLVLGHGFRTVDLGPRRLRAETAALMLVAWLARPTQGTASWGVG